MSEKRIAYWKLYIDDWMGGTSGFTLEQEAFYIRFLLAQFRAHLGGKDGVPHDVKWLSLALRCDVRVTRRLMKFLIDEGKLISCEGLVHNPRMKKDLAAQVQPTSAELSPDFGRTCALGIPENPIETTEAVPHPDPYPNPLPKTDRDTSTAKVINLREVKDRSFNPRIVDETALPAQAEPEPPPRPPKAATVPRYVTEAALERVRSIAPGWDRQALLKKFLDWPGSRNAQNLDAAFLGWVPKFTKGRAAS
jgi:Protein of unknown function (DUF1376)